MCEDLHCENLLAVRKFYQLSTQRAMRSAAITPQVEKNNMKVIGLTLSNIVFFPHFPSSSISATHSKCASIIICVATRTSSSHGGILV